MATASGHRLFFNFWNCCVTILSLHQCSGFGCAVHILTPFFTLKTLRDINPSQVAKTRCPLGAFQKDYFHHRQHLVCLILCFLLQLKMLLLLRRHRPRDGFALTCTRLHFFAYTICCDSSPECDFISCNILRTSLRSSQLWLQRPCDGFALTCVRLGFCLLL